LGKWLAVNEACANPPGTCFPNNCEFISPARGKTGRGEKDCTGAGIRGGGRGLVKGTLSRSEYYFKDLQDKSVLFSISPIVSNILNVSV
jgi:hypothetical protein